MTIECLLPVVAGLELSGIDFGEKHITLSLSSTNPTACCPLCQSSSRRIHSRYSRKVAGLPWANKRVLLELHVRRFFCDLARCPRKVFCERLHPVITAYARITTRLDEPLQVLALIVGGEAGALLCQLLKISRVSADTLLNLSRKVVLTPAVTPKVVGIDEWALRKGRTYATILVDLETCKPIELLKDTRVETIGPDT